MVEAVAARGREFVVCIADDGADSCRPALAKPPGSSKTPRPDERPVKPRRKTPWKPLAAATPRTVLVLDPEQIGRGLGPSPCLKGVVAIDDVLWRTSRRWMTPRCAGQCHVCLAWRAVTTALFRRRQDGIREHDKIRLSIRRPIDARAVAAGGEVKGHIPVPNVAVPAVGAQVICQSGAHPCNLAKVDEQRGKTISSAGARCEWSPPSCEGPRRPRTGSFPSFFCPSMSLLVADPTLALASQPP